MLSLGVRAALVVVVLGVAVVATHVRVGVVEDAPAWLSAVASGDDADDDDDGSCSARCTSAPLPNAVVVEDVSTICPPRTWSTLQHGVSTLVHSALPAVGVVWPPPSPPPSRLSSSVRATLRSLNQMAQLTFKRLRALALTLEPLGNYTLVAMRELDTRLLAMNASELTSLAAFATRRLVPPVAPSSWQAWRAACAPVHAALVDAHENFETVVQRAWREVDNATAGLLPHVFNLRAQLAEAKLNVQSTNLTLYTLRGVALNLSCALDNVDDDVDDDSVDDNADHRRPRRRRRAPAAPAAAAATTSDECTLLNDQIAFAAQRLRYWLAIQNYTLTWIPHPSQAVSVLSDTLQSVQVVLDVLGTVRAKWLAVQSDVAEACKETFPLGLVADIHTALDQVGQFHTFAGFALSVVCNQTLQ